MIKDRVQLIKRNKLFLRIQKNATIKGNHLVIALMKKIAIGGWPTKSNKILSDYITSIVAMEADDINDLDELQRLLSELYIDILGEKFPLDPDKAKACDISRLPWDWLISNFRKYRHCNMKSNEYAPYPYHVRF
jgi:hypothetical protein